MNIDDGYALNEEARITEEYQCDACGKIIDGYAALDPCIVDGRIFCDSCASDLTTLRFDGEIEGVSIKPKKLKL